MKVYYCIEPTTKCSFLREKNICDYCHSCESQRTEEELQWFEEDRKARAEYLSKVEK